MGTERAPDQKRKPAERIGPDHRTGAPQDVGQFDIAPGETKKKDGSRDVVLEGSMESFPASDPPAW
ncbi:MAG: hypothetical protein ACJ790_12130 [Myxococcaceae bacterium]